MSDINPAAATSVPTEFLKHWNHLKQLQHEVVPPFEACPKCSGVAIRCQGFVTIGSGTVKLHCENGHEWDSKSARVVVHQLPDEHRADGGAPAKAVVQAVDAAARGLRAYTEEPAGPLEMLVMSLARELHDREHVECDWFSHNGSSVTGFCRRACEARGLDWKWVYAAIERERLDEKTDLR